MAYLDSGYVFLGSKGGDSQLIKLHAEPLPAPTATSNPTASPAGDDDAAPNPATGLGGAAGLGAAGGAGAAAGAAVDEGPNHVEVVEAWPSLAPIVDFVVMDLERQGQGQVRLVIDTIRFLALSVMAEPLHQSLGGLGAALYGTAAVSAMCL
jgi:DNA damage-binding protein 1